MENQHKKITGYRDLNQDELDTINEIKAAGESLYNIIEGISLHESVDKRWLAIAKTDFQTGIMALVRSVAKPDSF